MVSLKGFYRASIEVFGIFAIYGSMMMSIISAMYLIPTYSMGIIGYSSMTLAGILGIVYLVINLPLYSKLLGGEYNPSDKEKVIAIIFAAVYLILLLISIYPHL